MSSVSAQIARANQNAARLEALELAEKESSPNKKHSSIPTINPGSANIFYQASHGNKVFLGTIEDRSKLAHLSLVAREQLGKEDARASRTSQTSIQHTAVLGRVDHQAGLLVVKYINDNDTQHPKPITYDLLPADNTLSFRCKVHQACNAFRIARQLCGDDFRDRLCFEIRHLPVVTFADFQLVCEIVPFDAGIMNVMQNKVAYHTLRGWISEHELACIWEYVSKSDGVKGSNYVERINKIFEKLEAEAAANGRVFNSGWCAEGVTPPAPQSVVGSAVVIPTRPRNMTVGAAEKAPTASAETAAREPSGQQSVAALPPVVRSGARTMVKRISVQAYAPRIPSNYGHGSGEPESETEESETTSVRPSTAGPPQDLPSPLKPTPTKFTDKARTVLSSSTKLILEAGNRVPSINKDKIDWSAIETITSPKKPFGNVGGIVGVIKGAPGLSKGKGRDKGKVAIPEEKKK